MKHSIRLTAAVVTIAFANVLSVAQTSQILTVPAHPALMLAATESSSLTAESHSDLSSSEATDFVPAHSSAAKSAAYNSSAGVANAPRSSAPFHSFGVDAKVGVNGIGFDAATSLMRRLNLRGGATFFSYSTNLTIESTPYNSTLQLRSGRVGIDFLPFGGSFYLSGGVQFYNGNKISGTGAFAGGQAFTVNKVNYFSSAANPVQTTILAQLGNRAAPTFTIGRGNILPRKGGRITVPVELGIAYVNTPTLSLTYTGTACTTSPTTGCQTIASSTSIQQNIQAQQSTDQSDINFLKVYPILSIGIGYRIK